MNGQDPEYVCFVDEHTEIGACCLGLLAGQVSDPGFSEETVQGKERLGVVGYVEKVVDNDLKGFVVGFL